jgi:hypothetical protein
MSDLLEKARHAEIRRRYAWAARNHGKPRPRLTVTALRIAELERIFRHRYDGRFPDTPDGRLALAVMAAHYAQRSDAASVAGWIRSRTRWAGLDVADAIAAEARVNPCDWTADALGWTIKLTAQERAELKIRTIGAIGSTSKMRAAARAEKERARKTKERRDAGAIPRAEYEAKSLVKTRPWEAMGLSRSAWYRAGKPR